MSTQFPPPPPGPQFPPQAKRRGKVLWIVLGVVIGLLVLLCGLGGVLAAMSEDSTEKEDEASSAESEASDPDRPVSETPEVSASTDEPDPTEDPEPTADEEECVPSYCNVTRAQFGNDWPLTVGKGIIQCTRYGGDDAPVAVTFVHGDHQYALNGTAESAPTDPEPIDSIWADAGGGLKKDIGPLIDFGLALCEG